MARALHSTAGRAKSRVLTSGKAPIYPILTLAGLDGAMFEGKPLRPDDIRALDAEPWEDDVLRPLSWGELVARLSAVRDLRNSFEGGEEGGEASFDARSARRIAAHHNGRHDVNLDVSGNGKAAPGTGLRTAPGDEPAATRE